MKKILIVLLSLIFIGASFTSVTSIEIKTSSIIGPRELPMPGDLKDGKLPEFPPFLQPAISSHHELYPLTKSDFVVTLIEQLDEELYLNYLEELVAFGPRYTYSKACTDAGNYIYNEFVEMGLETRKHEWNDEDPTVFNVEATLLGSNEESDEIYIICAHYDTVSESPGADDDGSGVAAVMAAAKLISSYSTEHTVRFITFSGEEQGLFGSRYYVEEVISENIAGVLNVDMIGFAEDEEDASYVIVYQDTENPFEWMTELTINIAGEYQEYIELEVVPGGRTSGSDHWHFWQAGFSAIFYAEYNYNSNYHSPDDTIENMDIDYAVRNSRLILATLAELTIITELQAPIKPIIVSGPAEGKSGKEYTYAASTTDPQGDQIYYLWDWGDDTDSGWVGPYVSGVECEESKTWSSRGDYLIKVKAKDDEGHESEWSDPLSVSMPKNRMFNRPFINFLHQHPNLFPILRQLILKL